MKTVLLATFTVMILVTQIYGVYDIISAPHKDLYSGSGMITYLMYPKMQSSFNEARSVCKQNGGDLAKIDSKELMDTIETLVNEKHDRSDFFEHDYWVGLMRPTEDVYVWVADCSLANYTSHYIHDWNHQELCFLHKKGHHESDRKVCDSNHAFLCQINSNLFCPYTTRLESFAEFHPVPSAFDCENQCDIDSDCWGTIQMLPPKDCVLLKEDRTVTGMVNITSKICVNVVLNISTPSVDQDNEKLPNHGCSIFTQTASAVSPSSVVTSSSVVTPSTVVTPSSVSSSIVCPTVTVIPSPVYVTDTLSVTVDYTVTSMAISTVYATAVTSYFDTVTVTSNLVCPNNTVTISPTPVYVTDIVTVTATEMHTVQSNYSSCYNPPPPATSIAVDVAESIAEEIVKNLTVDVKGTSSHLRTLSSADDPRSSSKFIGVAGVLFIAVPMVIIVVSDISKLIRDLRFGPGRK